MKIYTLNKEYKFQNRFLRHAIVYDLQSKSESFLIVYKWIYSSSNDQLTANEFDVSETYNIKSFGHLFISTFGRLTLIMFDLFKFKLIEKTFRLSFDMCPWISIMYPSYYSFITTTSKLNIILHIICFHIIFNDIFYCNHFNLELIRHYFAENSYVVGFIGSLSSTTFGIILWRLYKKYHRDEWHAASKQKHELSTVKLDPCLNKKELDPALYFHNSIKVLKNEIGNFKASKLASNQTKSTRDGKPTDINC